MSEPSLNCQSFRKMSDLQFNTCQNSVVKNGLVCVEL